MKRKIFTLSTVFFITVGLALSGCSNGNTDTSDTTAPDAPVITTPAYGATINTSTLTAGGTAEAESTVELFDTDGTTSLGTATATDGNWSIAISTLSNGAHSFTATATDTAGNTSSSSAAVSITVDTGSETSDTTAPIITLSGSTPMSVEVNSIYTEPGATASDNYDGDITANIVIGGDTVITAVAETYIVTYDVTDTAGNPAIQVTRTVNVEDTTAPTIILSGTDPMSVEVNGIYTEPGAAASDNYDGDITANIVIGGDTVITAVAGAYIVTYDVTDATGNPAIQVTRTVNVEDTTAPVITLSGTDPVTVEAGSVYTDAGATASDVADGDLTASIVVVNPVDTAVVGVYTVTYNVADTAGNPAIQVTRTVNVEDTTAPVITLSGTDPITVEAGNIYTDAGATASDVADGDLTASIVVVNLVNTAVVGVYTVTYNVTDAAGNPAIQVTRTVNVEDTTAPTIAFRSPADSDTNIALDRVIRIVFSEPINTASFAASFTLASGSAVTGTTSFSGDTVAIFTPDADLTAGIVYNVSVSAGVTDLAGNPVSFVTWSFTTAAAGPTVGAFYSNAPNWNDYLKNDGADVYSATNAAANGEETGGYPAVIHGGEMRSVNIGLASCTNQAATDALGAFDWVCNDSTGAALLVSTGLKDGQNLSDLIDFDTLQWKPNSVTITGTGGLTTAEAASWWGNAVILNNSGGSLTDLGSDGNGEIYVITSNPSAQFTMDDSNLALVIRPGITVSGPGSSSSIISADTQNFLWLEGAIDATGDERGVFWSFVNFSVVRNLKAMNANSGDFLRGVHLSSSLNNSLSNVTASNSDGHGVRLDSSSNYNTLSNIRAAGNGVCGVYTRDSSDNNLLNIAVNDNLCGVYLSSASNSNLSNVSAANNGWGVYLADSSDNMLSNITAANNRVSGVHLDASSNNALSNVTAASTGNPGPYEVDGNGVVITGELGPAEGNSLSNITAANNSYSGVYLYEASNNSLSNITAANNGATIYKFGGILLFYADYNTLSNVTAYNGQYGVSFFEANYNSFTGLLQVGNNTNDCFLSSSDPSTEPGLDDTTCANNGSSDATLTTNITLASSFVAKVTADDTENTTQVTNGDGTAAYSNITDWTSFKNIYRAWGLDGGDFPFSDHQGQCTSGDCRIWDWSLLSSDAVIRGILAAPLIGNAADTITHTWYVNPAPTQQSDCSLAMPGSTFVVDSCKNSFLRNAVEIADDSIGNDNGLCETNETCLYTSNIGSYQGSGSLVSAGSFTDGDTLTGITLMAYDANGSTGASLSGLTSYRASRVDDRQIKSGIELTSTVASPPLLKLR